MKRRTLLPFALACGLWGCGTIGGLFGDGVTFGGSQTVSFRISENLNGNYPVAVEMVVVYNGDLENELAELTAEQWFDQRQQYLRDFSTQELEAFRWEWVPGQSPPEQQLRYRPGARSILVFASYSSPGEHRLRVESFKRPLQVTLSDDDFTVRTRS